MLLPWLNSATKLIQLKLQEMTILTENIISQNLWAKYHCFMQLHKSNKCIMLLNVVVILFCFESARMTSSYSRLNGTLTSLSLHLGKEISATEKITIAIHTSYDAYYISQQNYCLL